MKCSFDGCDREVHCKDLCSTHYQQMLHGRPLAEIRRLKKKRSLSVVEKAWFFSEVDPVSGCWNWSRSIKPNGYGQVMFKGQCGYHAHRAVYEEIHGHLPSSVYVLHRCDNRRCVNWDHLFPGTDLDNIADRNAKMRQARGETVGTSVLTWEKVREIRRRHPSETVKALAKALGVSYMTVLNVVNGVSWKE